MEIGDRVELIRMDDPYTKLKRYPQNKRKVPSVAFFISKCFVYL